MMLTHIVPFHRLTGYFCCLKSVEADNSRGLERLEKKERRFLRYIKNELIVSFWDNWVEFGSHIFEFDWCVGGGIVDYFRHGTETGSPQLLSKPALGKLLFDISSALDYLHEPGRNMVHGGVTTHSILVDFKVSSRRYRFAHVSPINMDEAVQT